MVPIFSGNKFGKLAMTWSVFTNEREAVLKNDTLVDRTSSEEGKM
jgi:hypothetical protein